MNKKIIVVTGASTGVGEAISLRFAKEGYTVCAIARNATKLKELASKGGNNIYSCLLYTSPSPRD